MTQAGESEFRVRLEVADLYEISFILCGMFFCERCNTSPPEDSEVQPFSDLAYYRIAELAYEQGWRSQVRGEYAVLCPVCAAAVR